MKRFIQKIFWRLGYELKYPAAPIYVDKKVVESAKSIVDGYTMISNTCMISLADQVGYCNSRNIPGAFVECGVWKGGAVGVMAFISKYSGYEDRNLHLFDAFRDICAPDPEVDGAAALAETSLFGTYREGQPQALEGIYDSKGGHGTIKECRGIIVDKINYPESKVHFHEGWFQDTVQPASKVIGPIALLRLDGDWYDSTKVCLEAFYDNVVPGGIVIIDDYLAYDGCKKAVDEFIMSRNLNIFLGRVDTVCYYFVKS